MKLKPIGDRLLVKKISVEDVTRSGIIIPDTAKERPMKGVVAAKGDGRWAEDGSKRIPIIPQVGQTVIFGKYHSGTDIRLDDADHLVIREDDILLIVGD